MKAASDLRRTILDASLDLISREGLSALSMREVARRAGVSHQAPYHYFEDREAILAALAAQGFELLRDAMQAAVEGEDDPFARLSAIGRAYIKFAVANPEHFKLMFRSELVPTAKHEAAESCARSAFDILVDVAGAAARARFGREDPAIVLSAWSIAHGLATLLLEGRLEMHWGPGKRAQRQAVNDAIATFEALLRGTPDRAA